MTQASDQARPVKRSVVIAGHRTSISLETIFWDLLRVAAEEAGRSINALVTEIDSTRAGNLSSAIRVYLVNRLIAGHQDRIPS
ncbi:MAG: ribbon-helix-helix domain-containing protein [Sphingomonadales bacterium]